MLLKDLTEGVFTVCDEARGDHFPRLYWKRKSGRIVYLGRDVSILVEKGEAKGLRPTMEVCVLDMN